MKLLTTSVIRGSSQIECNGGVYLVDLDKQEAQQPIDLNSNAIDWTGRGLELGFRGIAFDSDLIYLAASDELFAYDRSFEKQASWRHPYLKHCRDIRVYERNLYLVSAGHDTILGFDLDEMVFHWALRVNVQDFVFKSRIFDPDADDGPLRINKLQLTSVFADEDGMYIGGRNTGGMLHYNGKTIQMSAELPAGANDARPFRDGVLFNDAKSGSVRYVSREGTEDRALPYPRLNTDKPFGRGLCLLSDHVVATGSAPSTISIHDLKKNETVLKVNLSTDSRSAIHGLEVWPFD